MNRLVSFDVGYGVHLIDGYNTDNGEKRSRYFVELEGSFALGGHTKLVS
jgi:hypothetical protein